MEDEESICGGFGEGPGGINYMVIDGEFGV